MIDKIIDKAIDIVVDLIRGGETPSLDQVKALAIEVAKTEATAIVFAQILGAMAREAQAVRDAFDKPDGSVPDLGLDIEYVKPEET